MNEEQRPIGYETLAECVRAIIEAERAKRREVSEAPWPPRNEQQVVPMYGLLVRR